MPHGMSTRPCAFPGCTNYRKAQGYCSGHVYQLRQTGALAPLGLRNDPEYRFWRDVQKGDGCWVWAGALNDQGYGRFSWNGKIVGAHRHAWQAANGSPIPAGLMVDHICHNRACVRPEHLRLATPKQNNENRTRAQKTSTTGVRGVKKVGSRYRAQVKHHGEMAYDETFATIEEADAAARAARARLFTHSPECGDPAYRKPAA